MAGSAGNGSGQTGDVESAGGAAWVSLGSLSLTNSGGSWFAGLYIQGGYGGNDNNFGNGGQGGDASLLVSGPASLDSSPLRVNGEGGGNAFSANGGNGGSAFVSLGSLAMNLTNYNVYLNITGGQGGAAYGVNALGLGGAAERRS